MPDDLRTRFVPAGVRETSLSLAVTPVDAYTGGPVSSPVVVRLPDVAVVPRRWPGGSWLVVGGVLPTDPFAVVVDGGTTYLDTTRTVVLTDPDTGTIPDNAEPVPRSDPVLHVPLTPSIAYPFPTGTTLVRGVLRRPPDATPPDEESPADVRARGIPGAEVSLAGTDVATTTTATGEFVLWLPFGPTVDVARRPSDVGGGGGGGGGGGTTEPLRPWVRVDESDPVLVVAHPELGDDSTPPSVPVSVPVEARTTTTVELHLADGTVSRVDEST